MKINIQSSALTIVQYGLVLVLLILTPWFARNPVLIIIQVTGLIVGLWAILEMRKSKLNPTSVPRQGSSLITSGPYQNVRHPMYLSLMLYFYPVAIASGDLLTIVCLIAFTLNLIFKLLFEEKLLSLKFQRYDLYRKNTWRLIPWIY